MKYRLLKNGEKIRQGDQFCSAITGRWNKVSGQKLGVGFPGQEYDDSFLVSYRRPIKPTAQRKPARGKAKRAGAGRVRKVV